MFKINFEVYAMQKNFGEGFEHVNPPPGQPRSFVHSNVRLDYYFEDIYSGT